MMRVLQILQLLLWMVVTSSGEGKEEYNLNLITSNMDDKEHKKQGLRIREVKIKIKVVTNKKGPCFFFVLNHPF